jgi:DNA ligase-1
VEVVGQVRATTKKTEKVRLLADFLRQTLDRETELAALFLSGSLSQGKIGVGWRMIEAAISGNSPKGTSLTLLEVDQILDDIASSQGPGSADKKLKALRHLFERTSAEERNFVSGLLMGEIRQGALEGLILDAVSKAANLPSNEVRQAMMFSNNLGEVAVAALQQGAAGLSRFTLRLLTPVSPMLANSSESVSEALERMGEAAFEYKLDGARIQVHRCGEDVAIFTRQLQNVTKR